MEGQLGLREGRPLSAGLLVVGMHRSGTSALTGALQILGVELGNSLMEPQEHDNAPGYFENLPVVELHEALLRRLGRTWDDPRRLRCERIPGLPAARFRSELAALLRGQFEEAALWAVKDPRSGRLIELWLRVFEELGAQPRFLHIYRPPASVGASLACRQGFSAEKCGLLWADHCLTAERRTRGYLRSFLSFDELLRDPGSSLTRAARDLELEWPNPPSQAARRLREFLDPALQHHTDAAELDYGRAGTVVAALAEAWSGCASGRVPPATLLDALDEELDSILSDIDPLLLEHGAQVGLREAELESWRAKTQLHEELVLAQNAERELLGAEIARLAQQLGLVAAELARHSQELRFQGEAVTDAVSRSAVAAAGTAAAGERFESCLAEIDRSNRTIAARVTALESRLERWSRWSPGRVLRAVARRFRRRDDGG